MPTGFHSIAVADVRPETDDAVCVSFDIPDSLRESFRFEPGQHLTLRATLDGEDIRRSYSICSKPTDGQLRVAIKRVSGGRFSNWANDHLSAGMSVEAMPPSGSFTWRFDEERRANYSLFASGSGITPILSLLSTGLETEPESHFALFYGNRESGSIMFLEEIAALKNRYMDRLQVHHFLSREEDELDLFFGRIDDRKARQIVESFVEADAIEAAFVCGPDQMITAVEAALVAAGVDRARVKSERFGVSSLSADRLAVIERLEEQAAGRQIKVTINGKRRTLRYDPSLASILENTRAAGLAAPFACKAGVCATCRARLVNGQVEMIRQFGLSEEEVARGFILSCQAIPLTDDVEIDFDV